MDREIIFWSCYPEEVELACKTKEEAIEQFVDDYLQMNSSLPHSAQVLGFSYMEVSIGGYSPLDLLIQELEEEYGDPSIGRDVDITNKMREAEKVFIESIISEYKPWACEDTYKEEVDLDKYMEERKKENEHRNSS